MVCSGSLKIDGIKQLQAYALSSSHLADKNVFEK